MKKHIIIILGLAFAALLSPHVRAESFTVTFSQSDFEITRRGDTISVTARNGDFIPTDNPEGPSLPSASRRILNPIEMQASKVDVTCVKTLVASDVVMVANGYPVINDGTFDDVEDPITLATASELDAVKIGVANGLQNGYGFSYYQIMPYLYDAERKELYFVSEVTFTPSFSLALLRGGSSTPTVYRREMVDFSDALSVTALTSYASVEEVALNSRATAERIDYAIITTDSLKAAFDELVRWKRMKGLYTKVFTTEEIYAADNTTTDKPLKIKRFLYNLYKDNGLQYVLLGGDHTIVPVRYCRPKFVDERLPSTATESERIIPCDSYYACFDLTFSWDKNGNSVYGELNDLIDCQPEIMIGRLPVESSSEIMNFAEKIILHESHQNKNDNNLYLCAYDEHGKEMSFRAKRTLKTQDGLRKIGWNTEVLLDDNCTGNSIISAINNGAAFLNMDGHGNKSFWKIADLEGFNCKSLDELSNSNPVIITSGTCLSNAYDLNSDRKNPILSRNILNKESSGAVMYIGSSRFGFSSRNTDITCSQLYNKYFYSFIASGPTDVGSIDRAIWREFHIRTLSEGEYRYLFYAISIMGDPDMDLSICDYATIRPMIYWDNGNLIIRNISEEMTVCVSDDYLNPSYYKVFKDKNEIVIENFTQFCHLSITSPKHKPYNTFITNYETLHLNNVVLSKNMTFRAKEITIGENVIIKPNTVIVLNYDSKLIIKNAVKCEKGAELIINHN